MEGWDALYERPEVISGARGHERIYAPQAYARIRRAAECPIVLSEALALAQFYPLCWWMRGGVPVLVALLGLIDDEAARYAPGRAPLPLTFQAYPFVIPDGVMIERQQLLMDFVFADKPTDIGAPIILDTGRMSLGAVTRARTALALGRAAPATTALSEALLEADLLEPWPLRFDVGHGRKVERLDLSVIASKKLSDPVVFRIIEEHGPQAGLFFGLHRISLFRINALLHLARTAAKASADRARTAQT